MRPLKAFSAKALLIEDADQIDDRIRAVEGANKCRRVMNIDGIDMHVRQHPHIGLERRIAAEHANVMALRDQAGDQVAANKAGATKQNQLKSSHEQVPDGCEDCRLPVADKHVSESDLTPWTPTDQRLLRKPGPLLLRCCKATITTLGTPCLAIPVSHPRDY
jgi:hypothetical protein